MVSDQVSVTNIGQQTSLEYLDSITDKLRGQLLIVNKKREEVICHLRQDIMLLFENGDARSSLHIGKHALPMESPDGLLDLAKHLNILAELQKYIDSYKSDVLKTTHDIHPAVECSISIS